MKAAARSPEQVADRLERLARLGLPPLVELHTFGEELRPGTERRRCIAAMTRLRDRDGARLFVHVPPQQPTVVTKRMFDRDQVLLTIEFAQAVAAEGIILHRYWALAANGASRGIPKGEAEAAFNEEMRYVSRQLGGAMRGMVENIGFFWVRPRRAGRYLAGPLDHFFPWEVERFTRFLTREGIHNLEPLLDVAHATITANMFNVLRSRTAHMRSDPRFQGITMDDLAQREWLTPYEFLEHPTRYLHMSDAVFLEDLSQDSLAGLHGAFTSESMPIGMGNLDFARIIATLTMSTIGQVDVIAEIDPDAHESHCNNSAQEAALRAWRTFEPPAL